MWGEPGILGSRLTREHKCVYMVSTITSKSGNCHNYNFNLALCALFHHTRNVIESQVMFLTHVRMPVALFSALVLLESLLWS